MKLEVITIESEAFYALIDEVVERLREQEKVDDDIWIDKQEALKRLKCSGNTLQKFRDNDEVRFSQAPDSNKIVYDKRSIDEYWERNAKKRFRHG